MLLDFEEVMRDEKMEERRVGKYGSRDPMWKLQDDDDIQEEGDEYHDGGAYPEIRRWQYPLGMGKNGEANSTERKGCCVCVCETTCNASRSRSMMQ